jgi:hypothetical protein
MTEQRPQAGIAEALGDLSEQTRLLVREEIDAAQREMWGKTKAAVPAIGLAGVAGVCAVMAAASSYRFSLRLLEKWLPPATAALLATIAYGGIASGVGVAAARGLRNVPPPFPTETARNVGALVAETATEDGG